MNEQWIVGSRHEDGEEVRISKPLSFAEAETEFHKRNQRSNRKKRPDGVLHFIRKTITAAA